MKKQLLALTVSSLFAISTNAAVSGCPSGWVKSGDGKECVLTEKVDTPAIGTPDPTRPICINGFTYESATNKCSKTVNANTTAVDKQYAYQGALVFGVVREIVNGSCGTAKNTYSYTQPSGSELCSSGTNSGVSLSNNTWTWSCAGAYTGSTDYSCLSYRKLDGVCGSANSQTLQSQPDSGSLCNIGNPSGVSGTGPWNWSCSGINTGNIANCFASKLLPVTEYPIHSIYNYWQVDLNNDCVIYETSLTIMWNGIVIKKDHQINQTQVTIGNCTYKRESLNNQSQLGFGAKRFSYSISRICTN